MAHNTTVFRQLLDLLPRHEFDAEARRHQKGQRLRVMSRWAQFVALGLGQLAGLQSLRDIVGSLRAQPHKLYHLGVRAFVSRSSLARVNTEQPYTLYETLFGRLLARCQQRAPRHGFRFKNKLFAVDASTIDLSARGKSRGFGLAPARPNPVDCTAWRWARDRWRAKRRRCGWKRRTFRRATVIPSSSA